MASFFLVDHSLRNTEGHHFDYVQCVSRAATEIGFKTIIGAHRDFDSNQLANVRPLFRDTTYQPSSYLAGLRRMKRQKFNFANPFESKNPFKRIQYYQGLSSHKRKRKRFILRFADDCQQFFNAHPIRNGDHAFLTTVSELELLGLAKFLARNPSTAAANWHLQFHFNLYEGRTPEYPSQIATTRQLRNCFRLAKVTAPQHRIHFYTTSQILAEQYQRLDVGPFPTLPYPIASCFRPDQTKFSERKAQLEGDGVRPVRFTCPGAIRREKGHANYLQPLMDKIWQPYLSNGKAQLVLQRPPRKTVLGEKITLKPPVETNSNSNADSEAAQLKASSAVEHLRHPLPADQYEKLIKSTDCGLLFYDGRQYFSRRAGVMGELLSCGRPVIVPAGSWLSEQIKEVNFDYANSLADSTLAKRAFSLSELNCSPTNVPLPGGIVSFDQSRTPFEVDFELADDESAFVVQWKWHWPQETGMYAKVEIVDVRRPDKPPGLKVDPETSEPRNSNSFSIQTQTVGTRKGDFASMIFRKPLNIADGQVRLRFRNAFHDSMASIKDLQIVTLCGDQAIPLRTVGIVASDEKSLPGCIAEMVQHYDHYHRSAMEFAPGWYTRHAPRRTVAHLLSVEQLQRGAA